MRCQRLRPAILSRFAMDDAADFRGMNSTPDWTFEMREHRFSVGQTVRMPNRFGAVKTNDLLFTVTGKMPAKDRSPQYRVRSEEERHERVVTEDMLEATATQSESVDDAEQLFAPREKRATPD